MVAHVEIDHAFGPDHLGAGPDPGRNGGRQCPAKIELTRHAAGHGAGGEDRILGAYTEARHQLRDGPGIDRTNLGAGDPLQRIHVVDAEIETGARSPVHPQTDVAGREAAGRGVNRLADPTGFDGGCRFEIARIEPKDVADEQPPASRAFRPCHGLGSPERMGHGLFHQHGPTGLEQRTDDRLVQTIRHGDHGRIEPRESVQSVGSGRYGTPKRSATGRPARSDGPPPRRASRHRFPRWLGHEGVP